MHRRHIVFERLTPTDLVAAGWCALRGYRIAYLDTAFGAPGPWWFRHLVAAGTARALRLKEPLYVRFNGAGDMAAERTEDIYKRLYARHPLIRQMVDLFHDERIHLAFKKYLNALLEQHGHYALLGERVRETLAVDDAFWFVPARSAGGALPPVTATNLPPWGLPFLRGRAVEACLPPLAFRVPWWSQAQGRLLELWENGRVCVETAILAIWQFLFGRRHPAPCHQYAFAVALIAPEREFANAIRGCDMLLDGERIRQENTLFVPVAHLSPAHRETLRAKGLHLADHPCRPSGGVLRQVLRHEGGVVARLWGAPWWIARVAAYLVRDYGMWSSFLAAYRPEHFICYNDYSFRHIPRNLLLHRQGVRTWYYADAINTFSAFQTRDSGFSFRQTVWSYLLYDTFVSWNETFSRFLGTHPHAIGAFLNVGCLWSEHVRPLKVGAIDSSLRGQLHRAGWSAAQKLVAVFDSTYMAQSPTDYADGLAFARGIGRLLDEDPQLFVVWKEKKARTSAGQRGRPTHALEGAYAQLARHPRCLFAAPGTCSSEAIALADLTVSFPFTSTGIEALGARVKAVYYDPQAKYRAAYYATVPGLVAHGYAALRERVCALLYATDEAAYDAYLNACIKETVDPYVDGRGLTRFREALCAGPHGQEREDIRDAHAAELLAGTR